MPKKHRRRRIQKDSVSFNKQAMRKARLSRTGVQLISVGIEKYWAHRVVVLQHRNKILVTLLLRDFVLRL